MKYVSIALAEFKRFRNLRTLSHCLNNKKKTEYVSICNFNSDITHDFYISKRRLRNYAVHLTRY